MKEHYAESEYGLDAFIRDMGYSKTLVNQKMQNLAMRQLLTLLVTSTEKHLQAETVQISH